MQHKLDRHIYRITHSFIHLGKFYWAQPGPGPGLAPSQSIRQAPSPPLLNLERRQRDTRKWEWEAENVMGSHRRPAWSRGQCQAGLPKGDSMQGKAESGGRGWEWRLCWRWADSSQFFLILIIILNLLNITQFLWWLNSLDVAANKKIKYPMLSIRK